MRTSSILAGTMSLVIVLLGRSRRRDDTVRVIQDELQNTYQRGSLAGVAAAAYNEAR